MLWLSTIKQITNYFISINSGHYFGSEGPEKLFFNISLYLISKKKQQPKNTGSSISIPPEYESML